MGHLQGAAQHCWQMPGMPVCCTAASPLHRGLTLDPGEGGLRRVLHCTAECDSALHVRAALHREPLAAQGRAASNAQLHLLYRFRTSGLGR